MGYCLSCLLKEHRSAFDEFEKERGIDLNNEIRKIKTIRDFDRLITVPTFGYKSAKDYYRSASLAPKLTNIRIPTLIFSSLDDPVIT